MSELEEIKARAEDRRKKVYRNLADAGDDLDEVMDDLDRVIAIAEEQLNAFAKAIREDRAKVRLQRDQARADVLKLRNELFKNSNWSLEWAGSPYGGAERKATEKLLQLESDTEHYEQYRQS